MPNGHSNERGIALSLVLITLVVVGALVAGAMFAGTQEQRMGENTRRLEQSFGVAEYGLADQLRGWQPNVINQRGTYPTDSVAVAATTAPNRSGTYGGWIYKLNDNDFLVDVTGSDSMSVAGRVFGGGARERLGMIVRLRPLQVDIQASLTTQGNVKLQGNATVNGTDATPAGWTNCDAPSGSQAGIRTNGGTVDSGGNSTVIGVPTVNNDPTVGGPTFTQYGDVNYTDLAALANVQLPGGNYKTDPVVTGGVCTTSTLTNWGDGLNPTLPCGSYFPIIHIAGDATLNGDQGQGILLVDGNLNVQGGYEFYGIAIILGTLSTSGGGGSEAHFWGGVMAQNADLSTQLLSGKATLNYSQCAIQHVLQATALPTVLRSRGWTQLY